MGLIIDSNTAIEAERQRLPVKEFLKSLLSAVGDGEVALCSIMLAELVDGVYRADSPECRERRRAFIDELKSAVPVHPIAEDTGELVGRLSGQVAQGSKLPFEDLLIAACALERGYSVVTRNPRHLKKVPGLTVIQL